MSLHISESPLIVVPRPETAPRAIAPAASAIAQPDATLLPCALAAGGALSGWCTAALHAPLPLTAGVAGALALAASAVVRRRETERAERLQRIALVLRRMEEGELTGHVGEMGTDAIGIFAASVERTCAGLRGRLREVQAQVQALSAVARAVAKRAEAADEAAVHGVGRAAALADEAERHHATLCDTRRRMDRVHGPDGRLKTEDGARLAARRAGSTAFMQVRLEQIAEESDARARASAELFACLERAEDAASAAAGRAREGAAWAEMHADAARQMCAGTWHLARAAEVLAAVTDGFRVEDPRPPRPQAGGVDEACGNAS